MFYFMLSRTGWVGAPKLSFPQARETRGTPLLEVSFVFCSGFTSVVATCYCR